MNLKMAVVVAFTSKRFATLFTWKLEGNYNVISQKTKIKNKSNAKNDVLIQSEYFSAHNLNQNLSYYL